MKTKLKIDGESVPTGELLGSFRYITDQGPPHAELSLSAGGDEEMGGMALNCLTLGDLPSVEGIFGEAFVFGRDDPDGNCEIAESVFWRPGDQTLEIEVLELRFDRPKRNRLRVEVTATCFESLYSPKVQVSLVGDLLLQSDA